ncbi:MAG TPA: uroporphyrinogen-III C-methyltransferase [Acetobacteraceae bacterium]
MPSLFEAASRLRPPDFDPGSVWLVGAGPGDPGLLTLHALHALAAADVVLHDALVPADILALADTARLESVGKRAGGARTHQLRINQRLIALARQGLRVVRLKGGDPLIFGRGGEEALALAAAGIPFRIVPGISAGLGGTASAGIPLTHRTLARSVAFATGHDVRGEVPDVSAFAQTDVLVFYMGLRHAGDIAAQLIAAGRSDDEAVAFVADATLPRQSVTLATLGTAAAIAATLSTRQPTLIVIGPVVALRDMLLPLQQAAPMTLHPENLSAAGARP